MRLPASVPPPTSPRAAPSTAPAAGPSRRALLRRGLGAAALPLAAPWLLGTIPRPAAGQATPTGAPARPASAVAAPLPGTLTKRLPKTGELLPALGLGTFLTFDLLPGAPREHLREVVRTYWEAGVRVLDTSPLYGSGETTVGDCVTALGIEQRLFVANKLWTTGDYLTDESHALRSFEHSQQRLWRASFDLMQCHSLVNVDAVLPLLQAWKKEGRTRHVGITHHESDYHDVLAGWIGKAPVDFVQVNYSIFDRHAEERVLPAAQDRGVAVLVNMALEKGRLHKVVAGQPLPGFAHELGIETWSQYFLKFVMSHPAVTCCLSSTADPRHAAENVGALRGPQPDAALRERMARHMDSIAGFGQLASLPWYPDKQARYPGLIRRGQAALRGRV